MSADDRITMSGSTASVPRGIALGRGALPRDETVRVRASRRTLLSNDRLAWIALAALIAAGAGVVLCSRHTAWLSPDSVRPLPTLLAGPLGSLGPNLHLGGVIALFTTMCVGYAALLRWSGGLPAVAILGGVLALNVLIALGPPLLSADVFSYGAYGRMSALYHVNPYLLGPSAIDQDAWYRFVSAPWVATPTAYGPLFTAISAGLAQLPIALAMLAYKLIAVTGSLLAIGGTAAAARRPGHDPVRAALLVGLNPVLVVYAVGGAHNDLIMLAALAWAIAALVDHRARTAGGLLVAATAVKLTAVILLPFALAGRSAPVRPSGHRRRVLAGAALVLLGVTVMSAVLFGTGPLHLLGTLELIQANGGPQSIPGRIASGLGLGRLSHGVVIGLQAGLVLSVTGLLVSVRRQRLDWITATGWAITALLLTSTFLLPWYVAWLLPFAALSRSRALGMASLALTAIGMTSL
jgi:hypothetical protein